jgi:hypothetical protein
MGFFQDTIFYTEFIWKPKVCFTADSIIIVVYTVWKSRNHYMLRHLYSVGKSKYSNKRQRTPKWQSKMDNPEKLATQDEEKQNKNTTQYDMDTTICKQTHIM